MTKAIVFLCLLLSSILVLGAPTTGGDDPVELTMDNFEEQVSSGVWWIKFYSPYCHHCTAFAPTWKALYQDFKDSGDFKLASVNCVTQGDLCNQQDIGAYPAINLYSKGKLVDSQKSNKKDFFKNYIKEEVEKIKETDVAVAASKEGENPGKFPKYPSSEEEVNEKYPGTDALNEESDAHENSHHTNPNGQSIDLDHKTFTKSVTATQSSWFIQFYSPTSSYSRNIQPAWQQLAQHAKGKLNIGQVNCDIEKQLCSEAGVTETPTLKYFASSIQSEYKGLRGVGDLLQFLERAVNARDPKDISFTEYQKLIAPVKDDEEDEVTFVYLYDKATAKEDFQALEKLAVAVIGTVNIVKTNDEKIIKALDVEQVPALFAISAEKSVKYPAQGSNEIRDHRKLVEWAKENRTPLITEVTPFNSKDIFENNLVVLAVLDPRDEKDTRTALKELRAAAIELHKLEQDEALNVLEDLRKKKQLKIEEAKDRGDKGAEEQANQIRVEVPEHEKVVVAYIDGIFWERWVKERYGSNEGYTSRIIINEESSGRYWDRNWGNGILLPSRSQILETISEIQSPHPRVQFTQLTGPVGRALRNIEAIILENMIVSAVVGLALLYFTISNRRKLASVFGKGQQRNTATGEGLLGKLD